MPFRASILRQLGHRALGKRHPPVYPDPRHVNYPALADTLCHTTPC